MLRSLTTSMVLVCSLQGCKSSQNVEFLEARLRENEVIVQNYERELGAMNSQLRIAQRESKILREQMQGKGLPIPAVEATQALAAVEELKFNRLLTASQDKDSQSGDEKFHAIVTPYDAGGKLVKVIGKVELEAVDLSLPEGQRTVGKWNYSPKEAIELWHAGYLSSGYRFELPWESLPQGNEVVLRMTLETPDGRELIASHTVKIEPPVQLAQDQTVPQRLVPPAEMQQVASEEQEKSNTNPKKPARPKPVLDLFEAPVSEDEKKATPPKVVPISFEKKKTAVAEAPSESNARPFPDGLKTSDTQSKFTTTILR